MRDEHLLGQAHLREQRGAFLPQAVQLFGGLPRIAAQRLRLGEFDLVGLGRLVVEAEGLVAEGEFAVVVGAVLRAFAQVEVVTFHLLALLVPVRVAGEGAAPGAEGRLLFGELFGAENAARLPGREHRRDVGDGARLADRRLRRLEDHRIRKIPAPPVAQTVAVPVVDAAGQPRPFEYFRGEGLFARLVLDIGDDAFGGNDAERDELADELVHLFKGFALAAEAIFGEVDEGRVVIAGGEPAADEVVGIGVHDLAIDAQFARDVQRQLAHLFLAREVFADLSLAELFARIQLAEHGVELGEAAFFELRGGVDDRIDVVAELFRPLFQEAVVARLRFFGRAAGAQDAGEVAAAHDVVGELVFDLLDGRHALRREVARHLQNIVLCNIFSLQIDAVADDEQHRFRFDRVLFHDGKILHEFGGGDHFLRHQRLDGLVEIGIFFGADALGAALAVVRGEVAHGEGVFGYDLQKVEVFPEAEEVRDPFGLHLQGVRRLVKGVFALHVLAKIQPEDIDFDGVPVRRSHIFLDKLVLDVCVRGEGELPRVRAKSHDQTPRNA